MIDLFAGPGGLGEGFSAAKDSRGNAVFRTIVSIEKDSHAHATLMLRAFVRQFSRAARPTALRQLLEGGATDVASIYGAHPEAAARAADEALRLELAKETRQQSTTAIRQRLASTNELVLIGGPPCQAYSLMGRARNRGVKGYTLEADLRAELYVEYLHVLQRFEPAVFVMENVKGLLSAQLHGTSLFTRILEDLHAPSEALNAPGSRHRRGKRYRLVALTTGGVTAGGIALPETEFVVRAEKYGVPQKRHRVIILGVREDVSLQDKRCALVASAPVTLQDQIGWMPRVRSGLSRTTDSPAAWSRAVREAARLVRACTNDQPEVRALMRSFEQHVAVPRAGRGGKYVALTEPHLAREHGTRASVKGVTLHETRAHMQSDLARYLFVASYAEANGRSPRLTEFPTELLPVHRSASETRGFADRFRVQLRDEAASTVTSHISKDGHYYIHPDPSQVRSMTVREAASLQTFPLDYLFLGNRTQQYSQVGNAVPPKLATQIADIVAKLLL